MDEQDNDNLRNNLQDYINQAFYAKIETDVPLDADQLAALQNLNEYCANIALNSGEVARNPLKIIYKTNESLKYALTAICLAQAIINPRRKIRENKVFFEKNIVIYQGNNNIKRICFGNAHHENIQAAIYWDIFEDWKLYFDKEYGGIKALVDEKTNLTGLGDYVRGGDPIYEFARFHRKYTEKENVIEEKLKISARETYQNSVIQAVTSEVAKQQLAAGNNPMDIINSLLSQSENLKLPDTKKKDPPRISHKKDD